jgi:hypothetical protein
VAYPESDDVMADQNNLRVPDDLLAQLQAKASAEGKSVDQLAEEALRKGLEESSWEELLEYGRDRGKQKNFSEEQAADVVHQWRREQRH